MGTIKISVSFDVDLEEWARIYEIYKEDGSLDLKKAKEDLINSMIYGMQADLYEKGVLMDQ